MFPCNSQAEVRVYCPPLSQPRKITTAPPNTLLPKEKFHYTMISDLLKISVSRRVNQHSHPSHFPTNTKTPSSNTKPFKLLGSIFLRNFPTMLIHKLIAKNPKQAVKRKITEDALKLPGFNLIPQDSRDHVNSQVVTYGSS